MKEKKNWFDEEIPILKVDGYFDSNEIIINNEYLDSKPSQKIYNHSPDGFSWGYGGSGPAQLALAILLKYTDKEIAMAYYQKFKWDIVALWPKENFTINLDLQSWIDENVKSQ